MPAAQKAVVGAVLPQQIGQASGVFNMLRQLGGAFGIALAVAAFSANGSYATARRFSDGFAAAVGSTAALAAVALLAALAVPRRPGPIRAMTRHPPNALGARLDGATQSSRR
jgi:hypothetical protein